VAARGRRPRATAGVVGVTARWTLGELTPHPGCDPHGCRALPKTGAGVVAAPVWW
jgi:hypothetical protein